MPSEGMSVDCYLLSILEYAEQIASNIIVARLSH